MRTKVGKNWSMAVLRFGIGILTMAVHLDLISAWATALPLAEPIRELLRNRVEEALERSAIKAANEPLCSLEHLHRFYQRRSYQPAWSYGSSPLPQAHSLTRAIRGASQEGLNPAEYHLEALEKMLSDFDRNRTTTPSLDPSELADLDLLLTDAFMVFGSHLFSGRVRPEAGLANWPCNNQELDFAALLESALQADNLESALQALLPQRSGYRRLREALARHREIAANGGWGVVPKGPTLRKGNSGPRVAALRHRHSP